MEESAPSPAGAVHQLLRKTLEVVAVVVIAVADHVNQTGPSTTQPNDFIALAEGPDGDRANRRVQARHIAASGKNSDCTLLAIGYGHDVHPVWRSRPNL